jgi:hypothetical protein
MTHFHRWALQCTITRDVTAAVLTSVVPPLNKPGISASAHGKTDQAIPSFPAQTDVMVLLLAGA